MDDVTRRNWKTTEQHAQVEVVVFLVVLGEAEEIRKHLKNHHTNNTAMGD